MRSQTSLARTLVVLALLLPAHGSGAQESADSAEQAGQRAAPGASGPEAAKPAGSAAKSPGAPATANSADTPGNTVTAPREYEASEQIREDLPVSFPVDI